MSIQTNLGQINRVLDWTCPSNTRGKGFTHPALSCRAEDMRQDVKLKVCGLAYALLGCSCGQRAGALVNLCMIMSRVRVKGLLARNSAACFCREQQCVNSAPYCLVFATNCLDSFHPPKLSFCNISSFV